MARPPTRWLVTCEHASRDVPEDFHTAFAHAGEVMDSHRAWDPGAVGVFSSLAQTQADHALAGRATRLLVDLNRSLHHPRLFSEFTRGLPRPEREDIIEQWWRPFREEAAGAVSQWIEAGRTVVHVSVHSFTPMLDGRARFAELGLLYDPARDAEARLARQWKDRLEDAGWSVRLNYPYRGVSDGHTTALRRHHATGYSGIELEINQAVFNHGQARADRLVADLGDSASQLRHAGW